MLLLVARIRPGAPAHFSIRRSALPSPRGSSLFWQLTLSGVYHLLRLLDPLIRGWWQTAGLGITARLEVAGRRSGRPRSVLIGLLTVDGRWYVGHPNGNVDWTRNLAASGRGSIRPWHRDPVEVRAVRLPDGAERDAAILITAAQQPFPGNLMYRAARRHILAVGVYFRLEPIEQ